MQYTKKRMEIMTESNDGFYISEEDLKLRGCRRNVWIEDKVEMKGLYLADIVWGYEHIKMC